jgi:DNA gyrase/topoisomerase IV subunit A
MKLRDRSEPLTLTRVLIVALGIGTAAGWGMWLLSDRKADQVANELRKQISSLSKHQMQLLHERKMTQATQADLTTLRAQAAALREEVDVLTRSRDEAQAELAVIKSELGDIVAKFNRAQADIPETGSTTASLSGPEEAVIVSAQKALTRLGYGPLAADGVLGPGTRRALEEFQYKNGLPVTLELDAQTLKQLVDTDSVASAQ